MPTCACLRMRPATWPSATWSAAASRIPAPPSTNGLCCCWWTTPTASREPSTPSSESDGKDVTIGTPSQRERPSCPILLRPCSHPPRYAGGGRPAYDLLGGSGQPARHSRAVPAWRPGRRHLAAAPALLRPASLPRDPVRPARRRQVAAAGRDAQQHDAAADRGYREAARPVQGPAMAGVRRLVGLDPGAGVWPGPP